MTRLLEGFIDPEYIPVVTWIILAAVALVVIYAGYRIIRVLTSGTFIAGGRNRKTRLAVMDAAAVDDKRRLVLVRRDDVEHLILIGGPSDVVVERDIRMVSKARPYSGEVDAPPLADRDDDAHLTPSTALPARQAAREYPAAPARIPERPAAPSRPAPRSPPPPQPAAAAPRQAAQPPSPPAPPPAPPAPAARPVNAAPPPPQTPSYDVRREQPRVEPPMQRPVVTQQPAVPQPAPPQRAPAIAAPARAPVPRPAPDADLDNALLQELEDSLDLGGTSAASPADKSLEDEMRKLLGELSRERK